MIWSLVGAFAVVLLGGASFAQQDLSSRLRPITTTIRNGGTYHLATHTWTRGTSQANLVGTSTIYNNTCPSGYFAPLSSDEYVDEGRVPTQSPNEPDDSQNKPGCSRQYEVHGFQVGYCTDRTPTTFGTYALGFFEAHIACTVTFGFAPTASFALRGLPASNTLGAVSCWTVNIDLDAPTQALSFTMHGDGDGTFGTSPDTFCWSMSSTAPGWSTGPIIAGNFSVCSGFDGTAWDPVVNYAETGTGMSTLDEFTINSTAWPGCYYFGPPPNPFASFHLQLFAGTNPCGAVEPGNIFCSGDGLASHATCPCDNNSSPSDRVGCLNSLGVGGKLRGNGYAGMSSDTLVLLGSQMPPASTCLYFQGSTQQDSGHGSIFGDGLRCAGGNVVRLGAETNVAGASQYPTTADMPVSVRGGAHAGSVLEYQVWYRNAASYCTSATFNMSNGYEVSWSP